MDEKIPEDLDDEEEDEDEGTDSLETEGSVTRRGPRDGSPSLPLSFFEQLPKTDLHVHLDGSLRLETVIELAREYQVDLPSFEIEPLRRAMNLGQNCGSLVEYLKAFDVTLRVL